MGFLNNKDDQKSSKPEYLLDITETPKLVRPLAAAPSTHWGHQIPQVTAAGIDGKPRAIRKYGYQLCTKTGRTGTNCQCCQNKDPLWHLLEQKTKTNSKGQRVDFPMRPTHLLPVLELATGEVKILKGGNGLYKDMDAWHDMQPDNKKNLMRCEWGVLKSGVGILTQYKTIRNDETAFTPTAEHLEEAKRLLALALQDMAPQPPDKFKEHITGDGYVADPTATTAPVTAATTTVDDVSPPWDTTTTVVAPPPVVQPAAVKSDGKLVAADFANWLGMQPEFQGIGVINNLVPVLQAEIGDVNYHKCSSEQLEALKAVLTKKLAAMRSK